VGLVWIPALRVLALLVVALHVAPAWAHGPRGLGARLDRAEPVLTVTEPLRAEDSAARIETAATEVAAERSGVPVVDVLAVLVSALGLVGLGRSWRRDRLGAIATSAAALLLGFVLETTPHLVHHSLDADQGAGCEALQTAERSPVAAGAVQVAPLPASGLLADAQPATMVLTPAVPAPRGRAPPA
jgi:hypothetical protein